MSEKQIIQESAPFANSILCALLLPLLLFSIPPSSSFPSPPANKSKSESAKSPPRSATTSPSLNMELFEKAKSLVSAHRFSQAEHLLSELCSAHPDDVRVHMLFGELLEALGRMDEASKEFARVAELDPSDPIATINLAKISLKQLELESSLTYAQQAVARDPSFLSARTTLIETLIACDQTGEAERQLKYISEKDRGKRSVQKLAYKLALKKGDYNGAHHFLMNINQAEHLEGAQKTDHSALEKSGPGNNTAEEESTAGSISVLEEIELLETLGKYSEARKKLETIVSAESDSDTFAARLKLARLLESKFHDYDEALNNFNEALEIDPLSATAIAGRDRCTAKRRNLALQLKIWLREFWTQQQLCEKHSISKRK